MMLLKLCQMQRIFHQPFDEPVFEGEIMDDEVPKTCQQMKWTYSPRPYKIYLNNGDTIRVGRTDLFVQL